MARVTQHKRKTGATTVKKDGKIIGNIGKGKTIVPQPQTQTAQSDQPTSDDDSTLQHAQQKFSQLKTGTDTLPSSETVVTVWNLTAGLAYPQRLETIANLYSQMSPAEKENFFTTCLPASGPEREYDNMMDALNPNMTMSHDAYAMLAEHPDCFIRESVMAHPEISQNLLAAHVDDPDFTIRTKIATRLSYEYANEISELVNTKSEDIHEALLQRANLPPNVINKIFDNATYYTKIHIAWHKNTSRNLLERLYAENEQAQKNSPWGTDILLGLARNPHTPIPILAQLCKHGSGENIHGIKIDYKVSELTQVTLLKLRRKNSRDSFSEED